MNTIDNRLSADRAHQLAIVVRDTISSLNAVINRADAISFGRDSEDPGHCLRHFRNTAAAAATRLAAALGDAEEQ